MRLKFYLGVGLVLFMAVSVAALVCCCYRLEWRLRLHARNAARRVRILAPNPAETKVTKQESISLSVVMPGDSIPSFLAKVKPHGSPQDFAHGANRDALQTLRS